VRTSRSEPGQRSEGLQVRAKKAKDAGGKKCNLADDLLSVINGVQDHQFIQSVTLCKGKSLAT